MGTYLEHYNEAVEYYEYAKNGDVDQRERLLRAAQVQATLACAAALMALVGKP